MTKKYLSGVLSTAFLFFAAATGFADPNTDNADTQALQNFAAQNPQAVADLQAATQSGKGMADLSPKTVSVLQNFLAGNPSVANKVQAIMQPSNNQAAASSEAAPDAGDAQPSNTAADTDSSTNSDQNTASAIEENPQSKPYVPWQPASDQEAALSRAAFRGVADQAFPLSPKQIRLLSSMLDATQRAQAAAPNDRPPMPTSTSLMVNLDPGSTPPVIRLSRGFVSSLVLVDSTGAPWPIEAYDLGNPKAFNIQWDKKSNTLMVQAMSAYTYGNLAIKLVDMNTPVMLTLVPGQQQVDYRVDLRIQGLGPNAKPNALGDGLPDQADKTLLDILDGVSPRNAKRLLVSGGFAQAWVLNDAMYVRTRFTLLSPAWLAKMSSADGMNAYKLQTTPLLLVSRYGKVQQLKVEGL